MAGGLSCIMAAATYGSNKHCPPAQLTLSSAAANPRSAWSQTAVYADLRGNADYATLGLNLVLSIVLGFGAGYWLDGQFGTTPYLSLVGFGFGIAAAIRFIYRAAARMQRDTARDGFEESSTDRPARYTLDQEGRRRRGGR